TALRRIVPTRAHEVETRRVDQLTREPEVGWRSARRALRDFTVCAIAERSGDRAGARYLRADILAAIPREGAARSVCFDRVKGTKAIDDVVASLFEFASGR